MVTKAAGRHPRELIRNTYRAPPRPAGTEAEGWRLPWPPVRQLSALAARWTCPSTGGLAATESDLIGLEGGLDIVLIAPLVTAVYSKVWARHLALQPREFFVRKLVTFEERQARWTLENDSAALNEGLIYFHNTNNQHRGCLLLSADSGHFLCVALLMHRFLYAVCEGETISTPVFQTRSVRNRMAIWNHRTWSGRSTCTTLEVSTSFNSASQEPHASPCAQSWLIPPHTHTHTPFMYYKQKQD